MSFDMGWNKSTTEKLYDSLSGHAFMIGCQTGMVIGLMTKNKNTVFVDPPINSIQKHLDMIAWSTEQHLMVQWKKELP